MDPILSRLSSTVPGAETLEQLTRPLLEMLGLATGMESTYLTMVDLDADSQHVLFSLNTGLLRIPEGLDVPWGDTLCKRALDEECAFTNDVAQRWGDSDAARSLGIRTYLSEPIRDGSGRLVGTLCGASAGVRQLSPDAQPLLRLFAKLVAVFMEREALVGQLRAANSQLNSLSMTDALTGLPNRRAVLAELEHVLAQARRDESMLLVGLIDLDGFKAINDDLGHGAGDVFLREISGRLAQALRGGDHLGRLGGDEFVVLASTPFGRHEGAELLRARESLQRRMVMATQGHFDLGVSAFDYAGASVGIVAVAPDVGGAEAALELADREMYRAKALRKAASAQSAA